MLLELFLVSCQVTYIFTSYLEFKLQIHECALIWVDKGLLFNQVDDHHFVAVLLLNLFCFQWGAESPKATTTKLILTEFSVIMQLTEK